MKAIRAIIIVVLICAGIANAKAQQGVTSSAGGTATGSGGTANFSVGQIVYTASNGAGGSASAGIEQPYEIFAGVGDVQGVDLKINVYPNPFSTKVNLSVVGHALNNLDMQVYDAKGTMVISQHISNNVTDVAMQKLPAGSYLLSVTESQKAIKTFTVIKNQ